MIIIENINYDLVQLKVTSPIKVGDFKGIAPQIDALIKEKGTIRLLIDGRSFKGWENMKAFKEHFSFVKKTSFKSKKDCHRYWILVATLASSTCQTTFASTSKSV